MTTQPRITEDYRKQQETIAIYSIAKTTFVRTLWQIVFSTGCILLETEQSFDALHCGPECRSIALRGWATSTAVLAVCHHIRAHSHS